MAVNAVALRKRQQILKANQMMFIWVAVASAIIGTAIVLSVFLVKKGLYKNKVLAEKSKTASILVSNNKLMEGLANQVSALNTNDSLKEVSASKNNPPIQSVLDALPATANASAFGASLQKRFIQVEGSGVSLESLRVDPVGDQLGESLGIGDMNTGTINFSFKVSASTQGQSIEFAYTALKNLLDKMEKSIRPIDIISVKIEVQNNSVDLSAEGRTFFEPKQTVELRDKVVRP